MARDKAIQQNIDASDLFNYPNKRIRNNDGSGNGTPVDESVYGDQHEFFAKVMRDAKTSFNNIPDNTTNGYQLYDALMSLAGKNDLLKNLGLIGLDTITIPIPIGSMKLDEAILFKSTFDSTGAMILIRGNDNIQKTLTIPGGFKNGQTVRAVNTAGNISLTGQYDSQLLPNLVQTIADINTTFQNLTKIISVFQPGGGMILWQKAANLIPVGWAEVVDWRARLPMGWDPTQTEFDTVGETGGSKTKSILKTNLPAEGIKIYPTKSTSGEWRTGTGSGRPVLNVLPAPFSNAFEYSEERTTANLGDGAALNVLNPYRIVVFIEYIG